MATRTVVATPLAPRAIGPYSQAIKIGDMIFISGQIALDPQTGEMIAGGVAEQTHRVLKNIQAILDVCQTGLYNIAKTTVYLKSLDDFAAMNEVYATYFPGDPPARATIEAAKLPKDALVEIDAIAVIAQAGLI
ncbi:MAG: Enamine/imine deaminase [candidate division BRC1 bacterium ADurb.BinA364]|nr:MAG: Enamine/imine deaminase [candidate division BRC1 bacterium ADurb.BinA364]